MLLRRLKLTLSSGLRQYVAKSTTSGSSSMQTWRLQQHQRSVLACTPRLGRLPQPASFHRRHSVARAAAVQPAGSQGPLDLDTVLGRVRQAVQGSNPLCKAQGNRDVSVRTLHAVAYLRCMPSLPHKRCSSVCGIDTPHSRLEPPVCESPGFKQSC